MAREIERKYLVKHELLPELSNGVKMVQCYLVRSEKFTLRLRLADQKAFLTIKGRSSEDGLSRYEWEKEIPVSEAFELMALCGSGVIDKTRYLVPFGKHTYEVDVFHGANEGLVLAEIELSDEQEAFEKPSWLGEEVTGEVRYYNSMLSLHPFSK